jgi:glutamine synthetase
MTPEQVTELGWDTKLPETLGDSIQALEAAVQAHKLDELGVDFLNMYIDFKKLEAKQAGEKTEKEKLDVLSKIF